MGEFCRSATHGEVVGNACLGWCSLSNRSWTPMLEQNAPPKGFHRRVMYREALASLSHQSWLSKWRDCCRTQTDTTPISSPFLLFAIVAMRFPAVLYPRNQALSYRACRFSMNEYYFSTDRRPFFEDLPLVSDGIHLRCHEVTALLNPSSRLDETSKHSQIRRFHSRQLLGDTTTT